ncbi:hypothetical protein PMIN03_003292 [Paraphaeosphaeria minitans]
MKTGDSFIAIVPTQCCGCVHHMHLTTTDSANFGIASSTQHVAAPQEEHTAQHTMKNGFFSIRQHASVGRAQLVVVRGGHP